MLGRVQLAMHKFDGTLVVPSAELYRELPNLHLLNLS